MLPATPSVGRTRLTATSTENSFRPVRGSENPEGVSVTVTDVTDTPFAHPPQLPSELIPKHVAVIMDGNGRWAKQRGLPRTAGHERGEAALFDVVVGAIEAGVKHISAYA